MDNKMELHERLDNIITKRMNNKMDNKMDIKLDRDMTGNDLFFIEMMFSIMDKKMIGILILKMNDQVKKWEYKNNDENVKNWRIVRDRVLDRYLEYYRVS